MVCAKCGFEGAAGSVFCEACGETFPAAPSGPGCGCGAGPEKIDAQGICTVCGNINSQPSRDHLLIRLDERRAADSDVGQKHWRNEDFVAMAAEDIDGQPATVFVVSDGVSTSDNPDLASERACKAALDAVMAALRDGTPDPQAAVRKAILSAQDAVLDVPYRPDGRKQPPEATILVVLAHRGTATIGWLGDTRAYAVSGSHAVLLTADHSWINEVVDSGQMTLDQAMADKRAHSITQSLGPLPAGESLEPGVKSLPLDGIGCLIGCTDGFWNYAHARQDQPPQGLIELLEKTAPDKDALGLAQACVDFANSQGGHDNITVAVVALT